VSIKATLTKHTLPLGRVSKAGYGWLRLAKGKGEVPAPVPHGGGVAVVAHALRVQVQDGRAVVWCGVWYGGVVSGRGGRGVLSLSRSEIHSVWVTSSSSSDMM
jgi:hypothetical protein